MLIPITVIGAALLLFGMATTWLSVNSPVQLQPINGCSMLLGAVLLFVAAGGALL